jgi:hypothetical protein
MGAIDFFGDDRPHESVTAPTIRRDRLGKEPKNVAALCNGAVEFLSELRNEPLRPVGQPDTTERQRRDRDGGGAAARGDGAMIHVAYVNDPPHHRRRRAAKGASLSARGRWPNATSTHTEAFATLAQLLFREHGLRSGARRVLGPRLFSARRVALTVT